jgi:transposase
MGSDRATPAEEPAGCEAGRRSAGAERDCPCLADRLSLAGLPGDLRSADDRLQSLPSLGATWALAAAPGRPGRGGARRSAPARQHHRQSPSLGRRRKRGAQTQAIGRSRGGRTTKIHAVVDSLGRPLTFTLTAGQAGDAPVAPALLAALPAARLCVADTAYDSDALRRRLIERGTLPVIPNNPTRKRRQPFDPIAYRLRNLIERAFCRLKDWRRIATRYDKLARNYAAAVAIAILITWWI